MARELNFSPLDAEPDERASKRWVSREPRDTVQMSVRMQSDIYDRFRELCVQERRTNGEMLEEFLNVYERLRRAALPERRSAREMLHLLMESRSMGEEEEK